MVAQKPALLVILFSLHGREMGALTLIKLSYFFYRYLRDRLICYLKLAYAFVSKMGVGVGARGWEDR